MILTGKPDFHVLGAGLAVAGASGSSNVFGYLANPWGIDVIVTRALARVTTVASAAATLDIGIGSSASTANDGLFDGLDVNAATGIFDNLNDTHNGSNGGTNILWPAGSYLTVKEASGNVNGLVAYVLIQAVPASI